MGVGKVSATAVVGAQWGDEGKGKVVDAMAAGAAMVVRYNGGENAGHTIVNEYGEISLHLVPSGVFHRGVDCVVGTGVVVNPVLLADEIDVLAARGVDTSRIWLSDRAHLVLPYHRSLDLAQEATRGAARIGTTGRGIGPAYGHKALRMGLQAGDLGDAAYLADRVAALSAECNPNLARAGQPTLDPAAVTADLLAAGQRLAGRVVDTLPLVAAALTGSRPVILEGQLGVMRDLDWGTYPYVTSSTTLAAGAGAGAGVPPGAIGRVLGVVKAYTTAVGEGPLPTEDTGAAGEELRSAGHEYGATTGRPRRCGPLDLVALRYAATLDGFAAVAVTKLDVLDGLAEIRVATAYRLDGQLVTTVPRARDLARVQPVYESLPGWRRPTGGCRTVADLPREARRYLELIEETVSAPVAMVSVGPERDATIRVTEL